MKKSRTTTPRRALAVFLSLLMLLTAWVFVAPTASAANEITYEPTSSGAYVYFNASGTVSSIQAPTWTEYNGQDDIGSWPNMTSGSWTVNGQSYNYRVEIKRSDHKNEGGLYQTHIYQNGSMKANISYTLPYVRPYNAEYYYPSGSRFVKNLATVWAGTKSNGQKYARNAVGFSSGSNFSGANDTPYDTSNNAAWVNQDLNEDASGSYVYMSFNLTTDPAAANACTSVGLEVSGFSNFNSGGSVSATVNGKTATWYKANAETSSTYNPKLGGDGVVNLNRSAGGNDIYLYGTYDKNFGPAIDCISVVDTSDGESKPSGYKAGNTYYNGAGWYSAVAINEPSQTEPDLNRDAGGDFIYMYYHTPCTTLNAEALRWAYKMALETSHNGGSSSALTNALNTAAAILSDLSDGYTCTYTQANIDSAKNSLLNALPTASLSTQYNLNINVANEGFCYKFTPSSSGPYIFWAQGSAGDPLGYIYDANGTQLVKHDDIGSSHAMYSLLNMSSTNRHYATYEMTSGTTYYLYSRNYYESYYDDYPVMISNPVTLTFNSAGGNGNDVKSDVPSGATLSLSKASVTRNNHTLIGWGENDYDYNRSQPREYTTTGSITVPDSDATYVAIWKPDNPTTVSANTTYTSSVAAAYQNNFYKFTPSSTRDYLFFSTGNNDAFGIMYEQSAWANNATIYAYDDDSGGSSQFKMRAQLTAGTNYLLGVKRYGTGTGNVPFRIEEVYKITYDLDGGTGTFNDQDKFYNKEISINSAEPTMANHIFEGWSTTRHSASVQYAPGASYNENADLDLYAVWKYPVTLNSTDVGYTVTTAPASHVNYGQSVSFAVTLDDGHSKDTPAVTATNGTVTSAKSGNVITYTVSDITAATVINIGDAAVNSYTVRFLDQNGDIIGEPQTVIHGGDATPPADLEDYADAGYHYTFTGWTGYTNITADKDIAAPFTAGAHRFTESVAADRYLVTGATCTEPAVYYYSCACGYKGNRTFPSGNPLGHSMTPTAASPANCAHGGNTAYWYCSRCEKYFSDENGNTEIAENSWILQPNDDHDWNDPTYVWADDGKTCTATRTCNNGDHPETETVTLGEGITAAEKTPANCSVMGTTTYTATFQNSAFAQQSKDVQDIPTNDVHSWNDPTYVWADDGKTCTATRTCNNGDHPETEPVTLGNGITSEVKTPANCSVKGTTTYTATFTNEAFEEQTKDVQDIPTNDVHSWNDPTYVWAEDNSSVTATRVCGRNGEHKETETVSVTSEQTLDPTCEGKGKTTYTSAEFENEAFEVQTKTLEDVDALGHTWGTPTYVWADDNSSVTATRVCGRNGEHKETETVSVSSEQTLDPTCEGKGKTTYTSAVFENGAFEVQTKTLEDVDALGHTWGTPTYVWADDNSSVTATRVCGRNGEHKETETVSVTSEQTLDPTCEGKGKTTYTSAVFENEAFEVQTKTLEDVDALGHTWGDPTYVWAEDNSSVTATRVCGRNGEHKETETVSVTSEQTLDPTCEGKGKTTYTSAEFENEAFEVQTKTLEDVDALGHTWGTPTYVWADDNSSVTATRVCGRNGEHKETETVSVSSEQTLDPTCEGKGKTTYTSAEFENEAFEVQTKTLEDVDALGHTWGDPTYVWAEDNSSVTATRVCGRNGEHKETETVSVTSEQTLDPTCEGKGKTTYTSAVFENGAFEVQTKTLEDVDALGHTWGDPTYVWAEDNSSVTATRVCGRNGEHKETETVSVTSEQTLDPTCEGKGKTTYTSAEFENEAFEVQTKTLEDVDALGHTWGDPTYVWAEDNSSVTATRVCGRNGEHKETETVSVTSEQTLDPTCEGKGKTTYTSAVFENGAFEVQTKTLEDVDALGHTWGTPTYVWAEDNSSVTATRVCGRNGEHKETETVSATYSVITAATCGAAGTGRWTSAAFENTAFAVQTKDIELPALEHNWNEPTYTWAADNSSVTATRTCNNGDHPETETVSATYSVLSDAGCGVVGTGRWTSAAFENTAFTAQTKDVVIPALEHNFTYVKGTVTCLQAGTPNYYICTNCGKMYLNENGTGEITDPNQIVDKLPHDYSGPIRNDNDRATHSFMCVNGCGRFGGKQGHTFEPRSTDRAYLRSVATCEKAETYYYSCRCGEKGSATFTPDDAQPLGHAMVEVPAVAATCTKAGNDAYWKCTRCDKAFGDADGAPIGDLRTVIPATGHGVYSEDSVMSGQTADGSLKWTAYKCQNPGCTDYYMKLTVAARNSDGNLLSGVTVKITDNAGRVNVTGRTGSDGTFTPDETFRPGTYNFSLSGTLNGSVISQNATVALTGGTASGTIGTVNAPGTPSTPTTNPGSGSGSGSGSSGSSGTCRYCGQTHTGTFGWLIQFFHNILYLFRR